MKKSSIILLAMTLSGFAFAAKPPVKAHSATAAKSTAKTEALICPVTGEKIASKAKAAGHSVYKGKTYYFCCPNCKPQFDKSPAKYLKKTQSKAGAGMKMKSGSKM